MPSASTPMTAFRGAAPAPGPRSGRPPQLLLVLASTIAIMVITLLTFHSGPEHWATRTSPGQTMMLSAFEQWVQFPGMDAETRDVVAAIHRQQNPIDCSLAKYYIYPIKSQGFGADLHYLSWVIYGAFLQNRVIVHPPYLRVEEERWRWADEGYCGNRTVDLNPDCYFEPFSHCQSYVTEEMARAASSVADVWQASNASVVWLDSQAWFAAKYFLIDRLPHSANANGDYKKWMWPKEMRYLVRPNARTKAWASDFLRESLYKFEASTQVESRVYPEPPPATAICMHVRQGDKAAEMQLHPVSEYLAVADAYRRNLSVSSIFVSTESTSVLEELFSAESTRKHPHFTYYFTRYNRANETLAPVNMASIVGKSYLALVSLANLYLGAHPSCVAFIETTASNWCEVINDIRVTDDLQRGEDWRLTDFEGSQYR